jgi:hypothetical protein
MNRRGIWIIAALVVLGAFVFGLSQAANTGNFRTVPRPLASSDAGFARYQVVTVNESEIILLDVTTGDLYSAKPGDVKPYNTRPRPSDPGHTTDKDRADFKDSGKEKDKPHYKDRDK